MAADRALMEAIRGLITYQATKQSGGNNIYNTLLGRILGAKQP